ncbi:MAG: DUF4252 domain-containing protein [Muribaculaceae bacterium]|nr:DUF4252 domain-containing protein [Muribaculaceae bacterium]
MKKLLVLALVAMIGATAFSKTIDEVFNAFPKADNMQDMVIDENMINMAMSMGADQSGALKDITSMRILTIENPSSEQLATAKSIMQEGVDDFDVMVDASEEGESALILTQGDDKLINKMLIIAVEDDDVAIVLMEGNINPDYANKYVNFGK